jgi:hypothetical protein
MEIAKVKVYGTQAVTVSAGDIPVGIIGATVSLEFSPEWAGLTKNVVFLGAKDVAMLDVQDSVYLPPEVVSAANINVKMGICGVDANKKMVIPTLWADLGVVKPGTPVNLGYDPQLPVWAQLLGMIGDLRNLTTKARDNLVNAINEAAQSCEGGVNEQILQEAINKALNEAKESGDFDGPQGDPGPAGAEGKSAYQYAVDGGFTGTEEEFAELMANGSKAVQPDWNQNDPDAPDYVKNRTHWEENSQTVIEWDGNTEGREALAFTGDFEGVVLYKVHNATPTQKELVGGVMGADNGNGIEEVTITEAVFEPTAGFNAVNCLLIGPLLIAYDTEISLLGEAYTLASPGIFAAHYFHKLTYGSSTVHQIDEKFIPDSIARKSDIPTDEHINNLINSALGVIENGTY